LVPSASTKPTLPRPTPATKPNISRKLRREDPHGGVEGSGL
jgi:hypothetical protein